MGKTIFISILFFISFCCHSSAQSQFQLINDGLYLFGSDAMKPTSDGGYILLGSSNVPNYHGIALAKFDTGGVQWCTRMYHGCQFPAYYSVEQTSDSGFVVAGSMYISAGGKSQMFIAKFNADGDTVWTRVLGGYFNNTFDSFAYFVRQTSDGGYVVTGRVKNEVALIKLNPAGDTLWTKNYYDPTNSDGNGYSVQETDDGGYIIGGSIVIAGSGMANYLMIKTDSVGNMLWKKCFGDADSENGYGICQTDDKGYIMTGFKRHLSDWDIYVIKTDSIGNLDWSKMYGDSAAEMALKIEKTIDGGYIIGGSSKSFNETGREQIYVLKIDVNGDVQWSKTYIGSETFGPNTCVQQTTDQGYIISTYIDDDILPYYMNCTIKTDSNGVSGCYENAVITNVTNFPTQIYANTIIEESIDSMLVFSALAVYVDSIPVNLFNLCASVGLNTDVNTNTLNIYPNPAADLLNVAFSNVITTGQIQLYNYLGEMIFAASINNEEAKEINLKNVSAGIYFVKVFDGMKYYCSKIIVEH